MRDLYGNSRVDGRRVPVEERKTYQIKNLWQLSHEILNLSLLGYKASLIAAVLGCTTATVSNTINSRLGQEKLALMRSSRDVETMEVAKEIEKMVPKALRIYDEILEGESASLSLKKQTADTIMATAGHGPKAPIQEHRHLHLTVEEINDIKERGRQIGSDRDIVVEGEDASV